MVIDVDNYFINEEICLCSAYDYCCRGLKDYPDSSTSGCISWIVDHCPSSMFLYTKGPYFVPMSPDIMPLCVSSCRQDYFRNYLSPGTPQFRSCLTAGYQLSIDNSLDCSCNYLNSCSASCYGADSVFSSWYTDLCSDFTGMVWTEGSTTATTTTQASIASEPTDAATALDNIRGNHPPCAEAVSSTCTELYDDTVKCWNETSPQFCFCSALLDTSCQDICTARGEPRQYLSWIRGACSTIDNIPLTDQSSSNRTVAEVFSPDWQDFDAFQAMAREDLFPWTWRVVQNKTDGSPPMKCPSRKAKLSSFAIINAITLIATLYYGRREFIEWATRGWLGALGSPWWPVGALASTILVIIATLVNAKLVNSTPGFEATPIGQLALLWFCRPRLSWLAIPLVKVRLDKGTFVSIGASAIFSEIVLQGLSMFYLGRTVNWGRDNNYYRLGNIDGVIIPYGKPAHMMYAGALLWMVAIGFVVLNALWTFLGLNRLVKAFFAYIFGYMNSFREPARAVMTDVGEGISESWNAITRSMKDSFKRGMIGHFARTLPPMENMKTMVDNQTRGVQAPPDRPDQARRREEDLMAISWVENGEPYEENEKAPAGVPRLIEDTQPDRGYLDWLYHMGLSLEALDKMTSVFIWMVLPFIGQWLFWVGFVDLAEDL